MTYVLSDLDGVLVDSGDAVERVWREWAVDQGVDPDAVVRAMHGVPARGVLERVAPHLLSDAEVERIDALHAAVGGDALPGAAELLGETPEGRLAIVTSCSPPLAAARLAGAGLPTPAVLITSDMTSRGKPSPDPYLAGAAALGAEPADCLVIEDAPAGVAAGRAAGMTVWAVTTTHRAGELGEAHAVFGDLREVVARLGRRRTSTAAGWGG
jgi:mannitol-1-/sugar-/sorbitol-6-phosphatase